MCPRSEREKYSRVGLKNDVAVYPGKLSVNQSGK